MDCWTDKVSGLKDVHAMMKVYLWLNCEGWVKFGPFQSLALDAERRVIADEAGQPIATWDEDAWVTHDPKYERFRWCKPMITASPRRPDSGQHQLFDSATD